MALLRAVYSPYTCYLGAGCSSSLAQQDYVPDRWLGLDITPFLHFGTSILGLKMWELRDRTKKYAYPSSLRSFTSSSSLDVDTYYDVALYYGGTAPLLVYTRAASHDAACYVLNLSTLWPTPKSPIRAMPTPELVLALVGGAIKG